MNKTIFFRGKNIGKVIGDTLFLIKKPKHFMVMYQGFGISQEVLEDLDVKYINMLYKGSKETVYVFSLDEYINSKLIWTDKDNDVQKFVKARGHEI